MRGSLSRVALIKFQRFRIGFYTRFFRLATLSEAQWRQDSAKAVVQTLKSMPPYQK